MENWGLGVRNSFSRSAWQVTFEVGDGCGGSVVVGESVESDRERIAWRRGEAEEGDDMFVAGGEVDSGKLRGDCRSSR